MSRKDWWLGFPRLRCPHCGRQIEGVKFVGAWKVPRVKKPKEAVE